jgi:carbon-monoxide dehydrogenase medium subunit
MAGGTDLLVQLRGERYEIDALVDIKGIAEVSALSLNDAGLSIGAAVPCYKLYEDPAISKAYPGLIDAATIIGGIQIQSRASLGGNLCNATPSADGICPLIAYFAVARLTGVDGTRTVPVDEFCTGPGQSVVGNGEMLISIDVPKPPAHSGVAYQRFTPRNEMDIAVAGVASAVVLDASGKKIESARIALSAVGPTPIVATAAAGALAGQTISDELFERVGELAAAAAAPINDMRGTVAQRKQLVRVLTHRTLVQAVERAKGSS